MWGLTPLVGEKLLVSPMLTISKKPQLGWRDQNFAEGILFPALFKFTYHEEMHKIPHGEKTAKWEKFVKDLFLTQPAFKDKEPVSTKSIKQQYENRINFFIEKFGWEDGRCKNLSGGEGDLGETDKVIK